MRRVLRLLVSMPNWYFADRHYVFLRCGYGAPEQERDISIEFYIRDSDVLIANAVSLMFNTPELDENFVEQEKCIALQQHAYPASRKNSALRVSFLFYPTLRRSRPQA